MIYIKVFVFTLILGLLSGGKLVFSLPAVPEYMLCFCVAYSLIDEEKMRVIAISAILAVVGSALSDRYMLFCVIEYCVLATAITEIFRKKTKFGFLYCIFIIVLVTIIGEFIFYQFFVARAMEIYDFKHIIVDECLCNVIAGMVIYIITYKLFNPRKKKYRITVE